jgi:gliding motility-associated-like protein
LKKKIENTTEPISPSRKKTTTADDEEISKNYQYERVDMLLRNANINKNNIVADKGIYTATFNYYAPHCPDGIIGVPSYEKITIKEIYPNIDWVLYTNNDNTLKYDFIVRPGADLSNIKMHYDGAHNIKIENNGSKLIVQTSVGDIQEGDIYSYQANNDKVNSTFKLNKNNDVTIIAPKYNKSNDLIIDPPIKLTWATCFGGDWDERPYAIHINQNSSNAYIVTYGQSTNFPTVNPGGGAYYQTAPNPNNTAGLISKFSSKGVLLWSTYYYGKQLGSMGSGTWFRAVNTDTDENIYIAGMTMATDFPTKDAKNGAYFKNALDGGTDGILLKFNLSGIREWATYYGGLDADNLQGIDIDNAGNIFAVGGSMSESIDNKDLGAGAYFQPNNAGQYDLIVLKFNSNLQLTWATFYGGALDESEEYQTVYINQGNTIDSDIDSNGNFYIASHTNSPDINTVQPSPSSYYDNSLSSPFSNNFIAKFSNNGILTWASYYGGSTGEGYCSITTDPLNNVYLVGETNSFDLDRKPLNLTAFYQGNNNGSTDGYIAKFNSDCENLWSTYIGGSSMDFMTGIGRMDITTDNCENFYIASCTWSSDFPLYNTDSASFHSTTNSSYNSVVALKFNKNGNMEWSTLYGGTSLNSIGACIAVNKKGDIWIAGITDEKSNDFPTLNPGGSPTPYFQPNNSTIYNAEDAFILQFMSAPELEVTHTIDPFCKGDLGGIHLQVTGGTIPYNFQWNNGQTTSSITNIHSGTYSVTITDSDPCLPQTITKVFNITEPTLDLSITLIPTNTSCDKNNGDIVSNVTGGVSPYSYLWSNTATTKDLNDLTIGKYIVTVTDTNGCIVKDSATLVNVGAPVIPSFTLTDSVGCSPLCVSLNSTSSGSNHSYHWSFGDGTSIDTNTNPTLHCYTVAGSYSPQLIVTDTSSGCTDSIQHINSITVYQVIASFSSAPLIVSIDNPEVTFTNNSTNSTSWSWLFGDGASSSSQNPIHTYADTGCYIIELVALDDNECSDTTDQTICVLDDLKSIINIPKSFTPNGDGINDFFKIIGTNVNTFKLLIHDRWGNLIFQTKDIEEGWDGKYKNTPCQQDAYTFTLNATFLNGDDFKQTGIITLIR